jgi:hypothetical protein
MPEGGTHSSSQPHNHKRGGGGGLRSRTAREHHERLQPRSAKSTQMRLAEAETPNPDEAQSDPQKVVLLRALTCAANMGDW